MTGVCILPQRQAIWPGAKANSAGHTARVFETGLRVEKFLD